MANNNKFIGFYCRDEHVADAARAHANTKYKGLSDFCSSAIEEKLHREGALPEQRTEKERLHSEFDVVVETHGIERARAVLREIERGVA